MKRRIQTHLWLQSETCWHQSEQQHFPIDAAHGKESEGAFIKRTPPMRTSSYRLMSIHSPGGDTLACVHTSCAHTGRSCCKCQRPLGEKAGRRTSRLIHLWIRKHANIADNKQTIRLLRPRGLRLQPGRFWMEPPLRRSLPITLRSHNSPNNSPNATTHISSSRYHHSVDWRFNFGINTIMYC